MAGILPLLQSCETAKTEFVSDVTAEEIPEIPELNYFSEDDSGELVTVDSFWFRGVAECKLRLEGLKEILRAAEKLRKEKK